VVPDVTLATGNNGAIMEAGTQASGSFMDNLPDTMKLDFWTIIFVAVLVASLFIFMKYVCFKPILKVMDDREAAIRDGAIKLSESVALVQWRQAEYATSLRELRIKALEHRKALSIVASRTKQNLLDQAHKDSQKQLASASDELNAFKAAAKIELLAHVDILSESLIQNLTKRA
jgi:F0F1-type ATP synthase membrane subunit b/b'